MAVKVLHTDGLATNPDDPEAAEAEFIGEARLMERVCNHPNVLRLLGVCRTPHRALIFPFYELGSLEDLLVREGPTNQRARLRWGDAVRMLQQAAAGVHHLHSEGTIHRDLACRNILVNRHLEVAVADFGLARIKDNARNTSYTAQRIGPIKWEAPEILNAASDRGTKPYSEATDVFSFGMCIFEVIAGKEPWAGLTALQAGMRVLRGDRLPVPPCADRVVAILMEECWSHEPAARPSMGNVLARLQRHLDGEYGGVPEGTVMDIAPGAT